MLERPAKFVMNNLESQNETVVNIFKFNVIGSAFASIVVEPIKDGDAKALVLVPGAKVKPEQYRELAKTIQQKFPSRLWVLIPSFLGDFPNPLTAESAVKIY